MGEEVQDRMKLKGDEDGQEAEDGEEDVIMKWIKPVKKQTGEED